MPVCRFARAPRCHSFGEAAAFGYDDVAQHTDSGLLALARLAWPRVIMDCALAPANLHELKGAEDLLLIEVSPLGNTISIKEARLGRRQV